MKKVQWESIKKSLGPGLVMAAAAIGVSHLVQSTRAGADFGFSLVWVIILAVLFKYPFLEFGPRYAIATGESLIEGYKRLGTWAIGFFCLFTAGTMFAIHAAVTIVTASLAAQLTGVALTPFIWSTVVLGICCLLLISGKYSSLDGIIKLIMIVLALSTLIALAAALLQGDYETVAATSAPSVWTAGGVAFLIALMGWMPIPIDTSAWHSIWTLERIKQTGYTPKLNESRLDFNIGYIGAGALALCFLLLGALVMFSTGSEFAASGTVFSRQLISLYTDSIGEWSYMVIVVCTFTTMFSTTITVTDSYPRVCRKITESLFPSTSNLKDSIRLYRLFLFTITALTCVVLYFTGEMFTILIDLATTLSFMGAPVLGYLNYRLMYMDHIPDEFRPKGWLRWLAVSGLLFLTAFAFIYLYWMIRV